VELKTESKINGELLTVQASSPKGTLLIPKRSGIRVREHMLRLPPVHHSLTRSNGRGRREVRGRARARAGADAFAYRKLSVRKILTPWAAAGGATVHVRRKQWAAISTHLLILP
jgi:hypothetical protein